MPAWLILFASTLAAIQYTTAVPQRQTKYLFTSPRIDGFNNQLQEQMMGVMLAKYSNRTLVLPSFLENVSWYQRMGSAAYPFEDYFDHGQLGKFTRSISLREFASHCAERVTCYSTKDHDHSHFLHMAGLECSERQRIFLNDDPRGPLGVLARLKQCAALIGRATHTIFSFLDPPLFGPYNLPVLGFHQGYYPALSAELKQLRLHLVPTPRLLSAANDFIQAIGEPFIGAHIRRGDFKMRCNQQYGPYKGNAFCPNAQDIFRQLTSRVEAEGLRSIILSSNREDVRNEVVQFWKEANREGKCKNCRVTFIPNPPRKDMRRLRENEMGIVEQHILSRAKVFIGTPMSSWSGQVFAIRESMGLCKEDYMWNVDIGSCITDSVKKKYCSNRECRHPSQLYVF